MVSIVITYIDETGFLKEALESALHQFSRPLEIIVVCNGRFPTDGDPVTIIDPVISWIHEPIPGSSYARNKGLHHASGKWIQFLDVDDLLLPDKIKNQMNQDSGAVVSPHTYRYLDGTQETSKWISHDFWTGLLNSGLGSTSSMLWNREALIAVGGWSSGYHSHQEYDLLFRLARAGYEIAFVDKKETIVRERKSGSITQQTKDIRAEEGIRLRKSIWNYLIANSLNTPERKKAFLHYIFRQLRGLYRTDPENAKKIYREYFSNERFVPAQIGIPFYPVLIKTFGFNRTEHIFKLYRDVRDKYLTFLPKNN